jgi:hypothetical protein
LPTNVAPSSPRPSRESGRATKIATTGSTRAVGRRQCRTSESSRAALVWWAKRPSTRQKSACSRKPISAAPSSDPTAQARGSNSRRASAVTRAAPGGSAGPQAAAPRDHGRAARRGRASQQWGCVSSTPPSARRGSV